MKHISKPIKLLGLGLIFNFQFSIFNLGYAQPSVTIQNRLTDYFKSYTNAAFTSNDPIRLTNVEVDATKRIVTLSANAGFAEQPFTRETVSKIRRDIERLLPPPYNTYQIRILANGTPIEELIPFAWSDTVAEKRRWGNIEYKGNPWTMPLSLPYDIPNGLQGRHFSIWASHGRYYDTKKGTWQWQRPRLYCTAEDIFTQSFVVPFLIPMLENAGAVVFTPRERDWQRHEVIIDNDLDTPQGTYTETNGTYEWESVATGFGNVQDILFDNENPFV